ncbi:MAG: ATP-binding cassette domain-containing protein, partial [Nitriliruptoraceae bacterium]
EAQAPPAATTALDTIVEVAPYVPLASGETLSASKLAERFGFEPALQRTPVELLSGGERRRLALLHVLVAAPNVLLLDEPTNDLDLDTLVALEDHLDGFGGTLVVASHDRYVLDRLTDRTLAVEHGQVTEFLDWASYREHHRSQPPATAVTGPQDEAGSGSGGVDGSARDNRQRQAERREARALEQRLEKLSQHREQLQAEMADAATQPQRLIELQQALSEVDHELAELEDRWLELTVDQR